MSATALLCLSLLATGPRATLELWSEPLGAVVLVDRRPAGATPLRLEILPGLHQVEVCARGHECVLIDHLAESGQAKVLWVGLGRPARLAVGTALASVGGALSAVGLGILLFVGNGGPTEADRVRSAPPPGSRVVGGILTGAGILVGLSSLGAFLAGRHGQVREVPITPASVAAGPEWGLTVRLRF